MRRKTHTGNIVVERHVNQDGKEVVENVFKRSDEETARLQRIVDNLTRE